MDKNEIYILSGIKFQKNEQNIRSVGLSYYGSRKTVNYLLRLLIVFRQHHGTFINLGLGVFYIILPYNRDYIIPF